MKDSMNEERTVDWKQKVYKTITAKLQKGENVKMKPF
jgi:nucleoid-associated protein YejK